MIQHTEQIIAPENLNLLFDEEFRQFCRKSSFQRGDAYNAVEFNKAERNEFILVQVAKVNTDCNFKYTAKSNSGDEIVIRNIFPTDHLNQNIMIVAACSKLLRQINYFRVWYPRGGIIRKRPYDDTEGLKYVQIVPEPKCSYGEAERSNKSTAFVHFTVMRIRFPVKNYTELLWKKLGEAKDLQQPKFRSFTTLSGYQKSVFVPDSFVASSTAITIPNNIAILAIIATVHMMFTAMSILVKPL